MVDENLLPFGDAPQSFEDDLDLAAVTDWFSGLDDFDDKMGLAIRTSIDAIIDTANTGRWSVEDCDTVELAYLGFKVENVIRGVWDFGRGEQMDYAVDGIDVDCKWSKKFGGWQIPQEAVGHICLLVWADDAAEEMAVGLVRIADDILVGGNQDKKRQIQSPAGRQRIKWLIPKGPGLPRNFLLHLAEEDRSAILNLKGGDARAAELFRRCEGVIIGRHTIESVGQQKDEGRRFRGETRKRLMDEGFEILNGHWKTHRARALELGGPVPQGSTEWVCLRSDGTTQSVLADRFSEDGA